MAFEENAPGSPPLFSPTFRALGFLAEESLRPRCSELGPEWLVQEKGGVRREKLRAGRWEEEGVKEQGQAEDAGEQRESSVLCLASRPGWGAAAGTAPGAAPLPANSPRIPPHSAAAGGCRAGGECWGWGRPNPGGGGGGGEAQRLLAPSAARDAAAAESLSLGHVIVSKRELRGSRRLGDHYKTQPGERVAATAAAAASPAQDGPERAAAAAARTAAPAPANLASSWHSQTPLRPAACAPWSGAPGPEPPPLRRARGRRCCRTTKLFPQAIAYSSNPGPAASRRRRGRRRLPGASFPSPYLTSPFQENKNSRAT